MVVLFGLGVSVERKRYLKGMRNSGIRTWLRKSATPASSSAIVGLKSTLILKLNRDCVCRLAMKVIPPGPGEFPSSPVKFSFDGRRRRLLGASGGDTVYASSMGGRQYTKWLGIFEPGLKSSSASTSSTVGLSHCQSKSMLRHCCCGTITHPSPGILS